MPNIQIKGSAEIPWRIVDRNINEERWKKDIANMKQLDDENLGRLMAISTILEGNGKPLGITQGQDVAARRLSPELLQQIKKNPDPYGRISLKNVDPHIAKAAIIQEKTGRLVDNGLEATPSAIATLFNGEKGLKEKTGKSYVEWLSSILQDIALTPGNEKAKEMLGSLLEVNSRDRR
jgi:hypothetical protein